MCGLIGIFGASAQELSRAPEALDALHHRGPDAGGEWRTDGVYLGHRRLSIIDLTTGQQPMHSYDGRYVIVFNGEIYNYRELRDELRSAAARFRTNSDTEVIVEGYRCWGDRVLEKLNGMFAFVIWDRKARVMFAARDRLGIKPLCWAMKDGALFISSTLEPFGALGMFTTLDPVAVRDLMTFDYIPAPRTIRAGVSKLEPGSWLEWRPGEARPRITKYWRPPQPDETLQPPTEEELEALLERVVVRQMVSDVPIGLFLSGGLDSSLLVALMARHTDRPLKTYSFGFSEAGYDESPIAAAVAQEFGTDHVCVPAEELTGEAVRDVLQSLDEPFCDSALLPLYTLSRQTRQHVKVALCGDGADEVFGGYRKYVSAADAPRPGAFASLVQGSLRTLPWRPRGVGRLYDRTLSPTQRLRYSFSRYGDFPVFRKDLEQLLSSAMTEAAPVGQFFEAWERHAAKYGADLDSDVLMRTDLETYLSENCLVKTDRASMLASLEVRVPYLDEFLLDRILPLPADRKIVHGELKALLQPLARRLLPPVVWDRPKHGFNVPVESMLATSCRSLVREALEWGERHLKVFNYPYLRRLDRLSAEQGIVGHELWNPIVMITWAMGQATPLQV